MTRDFLRSRVRYCGRTGNFFSRANGKKLGFKTSKGYWSIYIGRRYYLAHRLAWLYVYGVWPTEIDHQDRDKLNNAWHNLREATRAQNVANTKYKDRGLPRGVYYRPALSKVRPYTAVIKRKHIGSFATAGEARAAWQQAARKVYGEFAWLE